MHRIDLKKYNFRTDMITDIINERVKNANIKTYYNNGIFVKSIYLDDENILGKKKGEYITIEFDDITDTNYRKIVSDVFLDELKKVLNKIGFNKKYKTLVIGLGNDKSTPDSLGSLVSNKIIVTKHLFDMNIGVDESYSCVFSFKPGVFGNTGIETSNLIKSIVDFEKPDLLIAVDSLSSSSINRVNRCIQISTSGIEPGSGVGNNRKEISFDTIGIPVIAIGVPTVTKASIIVYDTLNYMIKNYKFNKDFLKKKGSRFVTKNVNYLKKDIEVSDSDRKHLLGLIGTLKEEELMDLIYEVLTPIGYNLIVTPTEIDFIIEKLSEIIGYGINNALHDIN